MIWITRLDGERMLLNNDQILYVEATHDTLLILSTGERLRVLESPEEIVDRVAQWRQRIMGLSLVHEFEVDPASVADGNRR
jgi:flagellar protein FlbD